MSTNARLAALGCAAAFASCSGSGTELPLIARGDAVRVISAAGGSCPEAFGAADFDDSGWQKVTLPMASVPTGGVCLRAAFDVRDGGGLNWSTDDDDPELAAHTSSSTSRSYSLDLRLFPSLLQAHGNVLALQIPETNDPVDIQAALVADDVAADSVVQVMKGPYRLRPSPTSTRIAWESDRVAPSWLVVDGRQYDGGWSMHHEVEIDGLVAGRVYSFYVATAEASALPPDCAGLVSTTTATHRYSEPQLDDDGFWKYLQRRDACTRLAAAIHSTPGALRATAADAPVSIAILGDTRADAEATLPSGVIDAVAAEAPDLVVHTGDVVASGADPEWQLFFDASAALLSAVPLAPVPGERDLAPFPGYVDRFSQLFGVGGAAGRAYSLDVGAVHLALLDSTASLDDQAAWLDGDLAAAAARGARHQVIVLHVGPWTADPRGEAALAAIVPVARRYGVQAIVSGHENIYEHGVADGLDYFVTGGAGATLGRPVQRPTTVTSRALPHYLLLEVDGDTATMRAKDSGGAVFDSVTL